MTINERHPVVELSNDLRIANFSSPHPFEFTDGTILPACPEEWSRKAELKADEKWLEVAATTKTSPIYHPSYLMPSVKWVRKPFLNEKKELERFWWTDIQLDFKMTDRIFKALEELHKINEIDIILVPLPMLLAIKAMPEHTKGFLNNTAHGIGKCRAIRMADRVKKTVHIDRFCI